MSNVAGNQYMPDSVSPPGETLLDILEERGMSQAELAERTGRPKKTISEIINGKAAITPDTALQLERVLAVPARFWNERERNYQDSLARQREAQRLGQSLTWVNQFPVKEMVKLGWIESTKDQVAQLQILLNFFAVASPEQWQTYWGSRHASYRKSVAFVSDGAAITAWLRKGELVAEGIRCQPYSSSKFKKALSEIRSLTVQPPAIFQSQMMTLCAEAGVAIVFTPELPKTRVSGVTRWLSAHKALIQMSLRYKSNDHFWFTFFHEAGHVLQEKKDEMFLEGQAEYDPKHPLEIEANEFSGNFLIPPGLLSQFLKTFNARRSASVDIQQFAAKLEIAPGIVVGRLQHEGKLPRSYCNDLKDRFDWA
jgi:HTH-type transcriptional regulator / antitoxin HigA